MRGVDGDPSLSFRLADLDHQTGALGHERHELLVDSVDAAAKRLQMRLSRGWSW